MDPKVLEDNIYYGGVSENSALQLKGSGTARDSNLAMSEEDSVGGVYYSISQQFNHRKIQAVAPI